MTGFTPPRRPTVAAPPRTRELAKATIINTFTREAHSVMYNPEEVKLEQGNTFVEVGVPGLATAAGAPDQATTSAGGGGCSCDMGGRARAPSWGMLLLLALALLRPRRRRADH